MQAAARARLMPDWPAALASGRRRTGAGRRADPATRRFGRFGRDVGGERGQLGASPRGQRPARPHVKLIPAQPAVHERLLQRLDHPFAVEVARPEPVTARRDRVLPSRHHRHLPC